MSKIEYTQKEVIEDRLLVALTEEDKVAIVLTKSELDLLITAVIMGVTTDTFSRENKEKLNDMTDDLDKLRQAAFKG